MITITYHPSRAQICSPDPQEQKQVYSLLNDFLSAYKDNFKYDPLYKCGLSDGKKHFFSRVTGKFPAGLTSRVVKFLKSRDFEVDVKGYPLPLLDFESITSIFLTDRQAGQIELYDFQTSAVRNIFRYNRGIVNVATNGGKTAIIAGTLAILRNPPSVVLIPRLDLLEQTASSLEDRTNSAVGRVGSGCYSPNPNGITVAMFHTACALLKQPKKIQWLKDAQVIFGDEIQKATDQRYVKAFSYSNAHIRVGFSGTVQEKSPLAQMAMAGLCGPVISRVTNDDLIRSGISARPNILILNPTVKSKLMKSWDWDKALLDCEPRHKQQMALAQAFVSCGMQTLVICKRVDHVQALGRFYPEATQTTGNSSNRKDTLMRLKRGEVFCCIATSIFDTGIDVPHIEALINAGGGRDASNLGQTVGRLLRQNSKGDKSPWFIDSEDTYNDQLRKQSQERQKYFGKHKEFSRVGLENLPADVYAAYVQNLSRL